MTNHKNTQLTQASFITGSPPVMRRFLRTRFGIAAMAALVIGGGLYFGWGYVIAAGFAPLILGILPCAGMCALGLCMSGGGNKPQDTANAAGNSANLNQISSNLVSDGQEAGKVATPKTKNQGKGCC